jgi:hypothetical protein
LDGHAAIVPRGPAWPQVSRDVGRSEWGQRNWLGAKAGFQLRYVRKEPR